jgi:pimeloyl-ACP methyl ester carboxylesterase
VQDYGILDLAADIDGIAIALGHDDYALVIHDWGAIIGWHVALIYPERVRAVAGLSVPYVRDHNWPAMCTQEHWGQRFFYWAYFAREGVAEAELESDIAGSLLRIYAAASGDRPKGPGPQLMTAGILDTMPPPPAALPPWLSPADLDYYVAQYQQSGFRGPINYYRNIPRLFTLTPQLEGVRVKPPATFMVGDRDAVKRFIPYTEMTERFGDLRRIDIIDGAGHWLPLEATDAVNARTIEFLTEFR